MIYPPIVLFGHATFNVSISFFRCQSHVEDVQYSVSHIAGRFSIPLFYKFISSFCLFKLEMFPSFDIARRNFRSPLAMTNPEFLIALYVVTLFSHSCEYKSTNHHHQSQLNPKLIFSTNPINKSINAVKVLQLIKKHISSRHTGKSF